ncbi:MAG: hypothetical protein Ta2F_03020 [Termitinemataceae bacterium]|nr:MAG: hypothetical protein Ta2F_03020 [Termitinemataceae bacterium]
MLNQVANSKEVRYEVNISFINQVREGLTKNEISKNIAIMPRDDDASLYIASDDEPVLLSFTC